jgi:hypothetical protein
MFSRMQEMSMERSVVELERSTMNNDDSDCMLEQSLLDGK